MDPRRGDYVLVNGRDYHLAPLDAGWVLERCPPVLERARRLSRETRRASGKNGGTMTLAELAITVGLLGVLGLTARRFGLSAIPAYLLAGLLLGPNEPKQLALVSPSEVTEFVAELGLVFLLFFLGLEFNLGRLSRTGRHFGLGGTVDLALNAGLGLVVGLVAFGPTPAALVLAGCVYVSSSAIAVKGLIDFRRLGDDETDLILAVLVFEDIAVAFMLGFAAAGGDGPSESQIKHFTARALRVWRWAERLASRFPDAADVTGVLANLGSDLRGHPTTPLVAEISEDLIERLMRRALDLDPEHVANHARAAAFFLSRHNTAESERILARGFRLSRSTPFFALRLAEIYRSGDVEKIFGQWFGKLGLRPGVLLNAVYLLGAMAE